MLVTQQPTTQNSQEYKQQCNPAQFVTKTKTELKYLLKNLQKTCKCQDFKITVKFLINPGPISLIYCYSASTIDKGMLVPR